MKANESSMCNEKQSPLEASSTDILVIGSGIAGLSFALHAAQYGSVIIITKKQDTDSNTNYAQGGIACVLDQSDSFESHINDTLITGNGICNKKAVEILVREGPQRMKELINWGVQFTHADDASNNFHLDLGREGGHSFNRIAHAQDLTGKALEKALINQIKNHKSITLYENCCAVDLITNHHLKTRSDTLSCYGAYILDTIHNNIVPITSKITYLATGGAGQVYQHTTNPSIATGDGLACAYRAGAVISNMEFVQFHPTTLYHPQGESFLISEALRGFGAIIRDSEGVDFMKNYHPLASLAPRDVVARAIDREIKLSGEKCVFLDITHGDEHKTRHHFPNIYTRCKELGIDITKDWIPVVPAAHYMCGGIRVDIDGQSSINRLYACGEVACTGVHGANRLASNSLLEAVVFSHRAAIQVKEMLNTIKPLSYNHVPHWDDSGVTKTEEWVLLSHNFDEIRSVMWDYVGIVRSNLRLKRALRRIKLIEKETEDFYRRTSITPPLLELRNIITNSKLIVESALKRHESRGLHYTTDYPEQNDRSWKHETILKSKQL